MVSSKTRKTISLAISLLVVVISLTGTALAASAPAVSVPTRYTSGFGGAPRKMATDAAGNLYVADFWAKGIVKLDGQGNKIGFIPTASRPAAVAVMPDNRLVVAMSVPQAYVAFYSQTGVAPNVTGEELAQFTPAQPYCRPSGIAIDAAGNIFVVDAGDSSASPTDNVGVVRVYSPTGAYLSVYGTRTPLLTIVSSGTANQQLYFKQPMGIAYEKASGQIVVTDTMNGRLQYFTWNGTSLQYVKTVGKLAGNKSTANGYPIVGNAAVFADPVDVAFEYAGSVLNRVYVADRARSEVAVVDPVTGVDLKLITGSTLPASVLVKGGILYAGSVADAKANGVDWYGLDGATVQPPTVELKITSYVPPTTKPVDSPLTVSGTVSPVYDVDCNVNGSDTYTRATPSGGNWNVSLALVNGFNYILCKASDGTTTTFAEASTYFTGTATSAITPGVTTPATGIYTNNATVVVSGTASAANANIQLSNAKNGLVASAVSGADMKWSATIALAEGANVITASAWKTGSDVGTEPVTVNVDFTPPTMNISFLDNGSTTVSAVQNLDGIVLEKNLSKVRVNGVDVTATVALPTADNTYFSIPVVLERGSNTVTVEVTDLANNTSSVTRTVTLNPEIPGLTVALPADNSYATGAGTAPANGTVDPTFAAVSACGTPVTPAGGNWSTAIMAVSGGFNSCQFTATGGGNVTVAEKRTINADAAYAKLAITSPPADLATKDASVIIAGTVAPSSPTPTLTVTNGTAVAAISYNSGTGAFSQTVNLGLEGTVTTVKVMADGATTAIRNIIYDATAPVMAMQANASAPTLLTGTLEPSAKLASVVARVSGVDTTLPLSRITFDNYDPATGAGAAVWHADLSGYAYSALTVNSVDPAGNLTSRIFVNGIPTGDVDGDGVVRLSDAMATLRHVVGTETLPGSAMDKDTPRFQADVGSLVEERAAQDGDVTVEDALLILQKSYGLKSF